MNRRRPLAFIGFAPLASVAAAFPVPESPKKLADTNELKVNISVDTTEFEAAMQRLQDDFEKRDLDFSQFGLRVESEPWIKGVKSYAAGGLVE